jgi:hypothetical protein
MATNSAANSFGTFLETLQSSEASKDAASGEELTLLTLLLNSDSQAVPDLLKESGMAFGDFAEALNATHGAGFTALVGPPGQERVKLTELGEQIARLER